MTDSARPRPCQRQDHARPPASGVRTVWAGVLLPSGTVELELAGGSNLTVVAFNRAGQTNDVLVSPGQPLFSCGVAEWRDTYCDSNLHVRAWAVGSSPGQATLTHRYGGSGGGVDVACEAALTLEVCEVRLEPVTSENHPAVYNPCGIAAGGKALYKIGVEPAELFPDAAITWSVAEGSVSFENGQNKGRLVSVEAGSVTNAFRLEVEIDGLNLDPKPFIRGQVLEPVTVPVKVWIVRDDYGNNPACTEGQVQSLLDGANTIYRQCAMEFSVSGAIQYTNYTEWLYIDFTNGWSGELESLRNIESGTGGVELYFVVGFRVDDQQSDVLGIASTQGIVLTSLMSERTLAHEIGHACGLLDVYPYRFVSNTVDMVVSGPVAAERLPLDWGGGYYRPGLLQAELVTYRLLMMGYEDPTITTTCDIPLGSVHGAWFYRPEPSFPGDIVFDVWEESPAPVGLDSMNRQPCHQ